jgi:3-hydroxyisobutyrate dehydrogenase-like beta-hydroxyacid dehydrogenase
VISRRRERQKTSDIQHYAYLRISWIRGKELAAKAHSAAEGSEILFTLHASSATVRPVLLGESAWVRTEEGDSLCVVSVIRLTNDACVIECG